MPNRSDREVVYFRPVCLLVCTILLVTPMNISIFTGGNDAYGLQLM